MLPKLVRFPLNCNSAEATQAMSKSQSLAAEPTGTVLIVKGIAETCKRKVV